MAAVSLQPQNACQQDREMTLLRVGKICEGLLLPHLTAAEYLMAAEFLIVAVSLQPQNVGELQNIIALILAA